MSKIFRKVALERLASPEQLDTLLKVTSARSWIALAALSIILVAGVVWSVVAKVPVTVQTAALITETDGGKQIATLFLSSDEVIGIGEGMTVEIDVFGSSNVLSGNVTSIGVSPVTNHTLQDRLSDPTLAALLTTDPISFEVEVELNTRLAGATNGLVGEATIALSHFRPIELIIPIQ